jgi:hypothetical protein
MGCGTSKNQIKSAPGKENDIASSSKEKAKCSGNDTYIAISSKEEAKSRSTTPNLVSNGGSAKPDLGSKKTTSVKSCRPSFGQRNNICA